MEATGAFMAAAKASQRKEDPQRKESESRVFVFANQALGFLDAQDEKGVFYNRDAFQAVFDSVRKQNPELARQARLILTAAELRMEEQRRRDK